MWVMHKPHSVCYNLCYIYICMLSINITVTTERNGCEKHWQSWWTCIPCQLNRDPVHTVQLLFCSFFFLFLIQVLLVRFFIHLPTHSPPSTPLSLCRFPLAHSSWIYQWYNNIRKHIYNDSLLFCCCYCVAFFLRNCIELLLLTRRFRLFLSTFRCLSPSLARSLSTT